MMKACRVSPLMEHVRRFRLRVVFLCPAIIALMACSNPASADDAIYQYAVMVAHRTTYLWVPLDCASVRGLNLEVCCEYFQPVHQMHGLTANLDQETIDWRQAAIPTARC